MSDFSPLMSATLPQDEQRPSGRDLDALEKTRTTASSPQKRPLRIAIVTENFLPKIDGVTRTLAMLLEHLQAEGHEAMVLGPATPLVRSHLAILTCYLRELNACLNRNRTPVRKSSRQKAFLCWACTADSV